MGDRRCRTARGFTGARRVVWREAVVALGLVLLCVPGAWGAPEPGGAPGSGTLVPDERSSPRPAARSDPALRARFLAELVRAPAGSERKVIDAHLAALGAAGILDALEQKFPSCHALAHELGKAAYAASRDLGGTLAICQTRCLGGCMHGVMMEAFGKDPRALRSRLASVCDHDALRTGSRRGDCVHAVGHAVAHVTNYTLDEAVGLCDGVGEKGYQYYCASGAYMQFFMNFDQQLRTRTDHYPCDEARRFAAACYRYGAFYILQRLSQQGKGLAEAIEECLALPVRIQPACFHGLGHWNVGRVSEKPARIREVCAHGPPAAHWLCIQGVVEKVAVSDARLAERICAELGGRDAEVCREAARNKMYAPRKIGLEHYLVGRER